MENTRINPISTGSPMTTILVPALKYKSGDRVWYAITLPYRVLGKFINTSVTKKKNKEIIKSEIKNRFLDVKHKKEIKHYIEEEPKFTIPPVTLVTPYDLDFEAYKVKDETDEDSQRKFEAAGSIAGVVSLPIDYEFECLDGNHRTAAIRELANENSEAITDSHILLNIVFEESDRKIRQDFVDVNKNAKQTSSSINTLFNTRDRTSGIVVDLIEEISYLNETTELLATSVSKNSKDIYTINNIKNAVMEIAGYNSQSVKVERISADLKESIEFEKKVKEDSKLFFIELEKNEIINNCVQNKEKTPEIRNHAIITSGTGIIIAARVAGFIFNQNNDYERIITQIRELLDIDWSRENPIFRGNIISGDHKILNSRDAISSAVEEIKKVLGYNISDS